MATVLIDYHPMARAGMEQKLFDVGARLPNGFVYRPNFLTEEEEETLLATIKALPLERELYQGEYHSKRRSCSFGWTYDFNRKRRVPGAKLPRFLSPGVRKMAKWLDIKRDRIVQAHVIEYSPGAAIGWHTDKEAFEHVIGLSLGGWCTMRLRKTKRPHDKNITALDLEPRSIYVMQKEVRWHWQHSVAKTKTLRYSITFRTLPK